MAVPSLVVYPVERDIPGLYRPCSRVAPSGCTVKMANLGKWFPPWTVMRLTWCFSVNTGPSWSTTTGCLESVCRLVRFELLHFTNQACVHARSAAKCGPDQGAGSGASPGRLGRPASLATRTTHRATDDDPLESARVVTYATQDESAQAGTSAAVSVAQYNAPPAPVMCPVPSDQRDSVHCRYRGSLLRMSLQIMSICPQSRPSCTHRLPGPGRQPLVFI